MPWTGSVTLGGRGSTSIGTEASPPRTPRRPLQDRIFHRCPLPPRTGPRPQRAADGMRIPMGHFFLPDPLEHGHPLLQGHLSRTRWPDGVQTVVALRAKALEATDAREVCRPAIPSRMTAIRSIGCFGFFGCFARWSFCSPLRTPEHALIDSYGHALDWDLGFSRVPPLPGYSDNHASSTSLCPIDPRARPDDCYRPSEQHRTSLHFDASHPRSEFSSEPAAFPATIRQPQIQRAGHVYAPRC